MTCACVSLRVCARVKRAWGEGGGGGGAVDAPLVDGKSPQIRRELTGGAVGAHSRGTVSPPPQQLVVVEWTAARRDHAVSRAAGRSFVRCERRSPRGSGRVPRNGVGRSRKLCASKEENKSRPLVSSRRIYPQACSGVRSISRIALDVAQWHVRVLIRAHVEITGSPASRWDARPAEGKGSRRTSPS